VVRRFRRSWPLAYLVGTLLIAALLYLATAEATRFIGDILFNRYDGRSFFYPAIYYPPFSGAVVIPASFFILVIIWLALRQRHHGMAHSVSMRYALIVLFLATILAVVWFIADYLDPRDALYPREVSSEQLEGTTYRLGTISALNRDVYVLYECADSSSMCRAVHVEEYRSFEDPFTTLFSDIHMVVDSGTLRLEVDGETVYSTTP
jgi:hypothetical protein